MSKRCSIIEFYKKNRSYYESYKRWHEGFGEFCKLEPESRKLIEKYCAGRVLDAGSGPGSISLYLSSLKSNPVVFSVDISHNASMLLLDSARSKRQSNIHVVTGDLSSLSFEDESFDCIICQSVLEHVLDANCVMRELVRVLRKEGYMLIRVSNDYSLREKIVSLIRVFFTNDFKFDEIEPESDYKVEEKEGRRTGNLDVTRIDFFKFIIFSKYLGLKVEFLTTFPSSAIKTKLRFVSKMLPFYPFKYLGNTIIVLFRKQS